MIDKVQSNVSAGYTNSINQVESKPETLNEKNRQISSPSAEVSLSKDAIALQTTIQGIKDAPDIRADIVQEIKSRVEAGTYKINVEALAERLLPFLK
ncbi:MAG: flagellar biosynthesis anti-sigma factor FlgM [Chloroflexota bacterium]